MELLPVPPTFITKTVKVCIENSLVSFSRTTKLEVVVHLIHNETEKGIVGSKISESGITIWSLSPSNSSVFPYFPGFHPLEVVEGNAILVSVPVLPYPLKS
jgi:hypothetical protein